MRSPYESSCSSLQQGIKNGKNLDFNVLMTKHTYIEKIQYLFYYFISQLSFGKRKKIYNSRKEDYKKILQFILK